MTMTTPRSRPLLAAAALAAALAPACARRAPADPAYLAEVRAWQAKRLAALTADDGWLSVAGLFWLNSGANRFGSAVGNEIVLPGADTPPQAGVLDLGPDGTVVARPAPGAGVSVDGAPASERVLRSDRDGARPDILRIGSVSFYLIDRAGKLAVRVKDSRNPARLRFKGIASFPVDPSYRVQGTFEAYREPRRVTVATAQGPSQAMVVPGVVRFSLRGQSLSLEPFLESPGDDNFFFVFRDLTSGRETYGASRFLDAARPAAGSAAVVLDFNEARNPPCAFTPFATCPLPLPGNIMAVRVEAGEKFTAPE